MADQKTVINNIRNFLAGRALGFTRDEALLDEVLKCLFCKLYSINSTAKEKKTTEKSEIPITYRRIFKNVLSFYSGLFDEGEEILLGPKEISYIDNQLSLLDLLEIKNDLVGGLYEAFIGNGYRGQEGQFFTPKVAINALVALTNPGKADTFIDPACGAGGFIKEVAKKINGSINPSHIHGIDKDSYLVKLTKIDLTIRFNKTFNVTCADSLKWSKDELKNPLTYKLKGDFDLVLTNPPFGSKIVSLIEKERIDFELAHKWKLDKETAQYVKTKEFPSNTPPQVLFIERCLSLLKNGGRLGIVVPESLLSSQNYKYVVQYILDNSTPLAVIGMPEELFKTSGKSGTHTKTCLLVLLKKKSKSYKIFMSEAKWCGHDSRCRVIPNDDIPEIVKKYDTFLSGKKIQSNRKGFVINNSEIKDFILAPRFYDPEPTETVSALKGGKNIVKFSELMDKKYIELVTGDEVGKLAYGTGEIPFIRTSDISNWEIKIDPKHCVSETIYNKFLAKQDVQEGDIVLVRDGTYLVGACAYITKYDVQVVLQSHLYKIRVKPNPLFNSHYLLALLSSPYVVAQIKKLTFTQDIINSLGDRIKDVLLPISKDSSHVSKISKMVKEVIDDRVEARQLSRKAREEVLSF